MAFEPTRVKMIQRGDWGGGKLMTSGDTLTPPINYVMLLPTGGPACSSRFECCSATVDLLQAHTSQGATDIAYNFLVGGDGAIYQGRGFYYKPTFPERLRWAGHSAITVGFIGDFYESESPYQMMVAALELIKMGMRNALIPATYQIINMLREKASDVSVLPA